MKATLFKEVSYSLSKLIEDIEVGEIGLPDIQRPFVWSKAKVRDLFDSMYSGFPVGYLLFWGNLGANGARQIGTDAKQAVPRLLIVDGQQRLTSLYAVLKGLPVVDHNYRSERIKIAFRPRDQHFSVSDPAVERDPEFIADISQLWVGPLSRNRFVKQFLKRLSASRQLSDDEEDHLTEAMDRLYDLQNYPFTALELSSSIDEEKVAEVFVRINSKGVTLNQADFILTLMSVWWDEGRKDLENFSRSARQPSTSGPSPFNHFIQPDPDQMLRVAIGVGFRRGQLRAVYSLLRGRDLETDQTSDEQRDLQFAKLQQAQAFTLDVTNWHEFLKVLVRAGFRSSGMISAENALLYAYVLYLIGKKDFSVPSEQLREVMARWFFMAALTGRYSSSPESQIESDLARLRGLSTAEEFTDALDQVVDDTLTPDFWQIALPNSLATSAARSPTLYGYYAALNLLDARVLLSSMRVHELFDPALKAKKSAVERHHLFPRAHLKGLGIESLKDVNQIANFALVEWPKNIAISGDDPADYWPAYSKELSPGDLERMAFWHALPPGWADMDYGEFLRQRRRLLAKVVRAGFDRLKHGDREDSSAIDVAELVDSGESATVEFKSTARFNMHTKDRDPKLELVILKTIAGFANAKGGTLLIGVTDEGEPIGLDDDLALMKKPDTDRYQLWLTDLLETAIGKPAASAVDVSFPPLDGQRVCCVRVSPAVSPVFVNPPGGHGADFYVRVGNSTRQFTSKELLDYQKDRWS
ncbi:MAG: DUF262 domain-containing protein [Solirubrobacteraceae bacterium]